METTILPQDCYFEILKHFDADNLVNCCSINKFFNILSKNNYYWEIIVDPKLKIMWNMLSFYECYIINKIFCHHYGVQDICYNNIKTYTSRNKYSGRYKLPKLFLNKIYYLINLERLTLNKSLLKNISKKIINLSNLNYLELAHNCILEIPLEVFQLKQLETLDISHNQLKIIPADISLLPKLRYVYLNNNQIESIPIEISLCDLYVLHMNVNFIKEIPIELCNLKNIEMIFLGHNKIKKVPFEMLELIASNKLDLENNDIIE